MALTQRKHLNHKNFHALQCVAAQIHKYKAADTGAVSLVTTGAIERGLTLTVLYSICWLRQFDWYSVSVLGHPRRQLSAPVVSLAF